MSQISSVLTATQTARTLRTMIEENLGQEIEIGVGDHGAIAVTFRIVTITEAIGTTSDGDIVIMSLGGEAELDSKYPTIVVGRNGGSLA